jgi:hypothetical protein
MLTLNQIVAKLREIREAHSQLNSFYFGDPDDAGVTFTYPVMGLIIQPGSIARRIKSTKFVLYFSDLVTKDLSNKIEVQSDMERVALGVFAQFWDYLEDNNIQLVTEATFSPFENAGPDSAWGWQVDLTINQFYSKDSCQEPSTFESSATETGSVRIYNLETGATVATRNPGQEYPVYEFSGINDTGPPYTNVISIDDNG